jgi:drug/metabolite transporter (DMT)-like permease
MKTSVPSPGELAAHRPRALTLWGLGLTDAMLLGAVLIWGTNFVVLKRALQELSPLSVNAVRFMIASACLLPIILQHRGTGPLPRKDFLQAVGAGAIGYGVASVFMLAGLSLATASQASLLTATMPIFVALLGYGVGGERLSRRAWLGIAVCFGGIGLVVGAPGSASGFRTTLGSALVLASALATAVSMVTAAPVLRRSSTSQVTTAMTLAGAIILIPIGVPAVAQEAWGSVTVFTWVGLLYSGVISIAFSNMLWNRGVQAIGPSRTAIYSNLIPVVAALAGWLFLGERLTPLQLVGAGIILSGLYLVRMARVL